MFSGLMSRCTSPSEWMYCNPWEEGRRRGGGGEGEGRGRGGRGERRGRDREILIHVQIGGMERKDVLCIIVA